MVRLARFAAVAALAIGMAVPALAQTTPSHLTGTVKDAQGAVLPGCHRHGDVAGAASARRPWSARRTATYRFPSLPAGTYTLKFELSGVPDAARAQNISLRAGPDADDRRADADRDAAGERDGHGGVARRRHAVDGGRQRARHGEADRRAELVGPVGRAGADAGRAHAGRSTSAAATRASSRGYEAFGITNQTRVVTEGVDTTEGSGGAGFYQDYFAQNEIAVSAAGQDVSDEHAGRGGHLDDQERRQPVPRADQPDLRGQELRRRQRRRGDIGARRVRRQPNLLFWENHDDLGGPIIKDKAVVLRRVRPLPHQQGRSRACRRPSRPTSGSSTPSRRRRPTSRRKDTLIGYYQWDKKQKPLRGLSATRGRALHAGADQPELDVQRQVAARLVEPPVHRVEHRRVRLRLPGSSRRSTTRPTRRATISCTGVDTGAGWFNAGGRRRAVRPRARQAAGVRQR